ncbi:ABC-2 type transport system ATP-binding protein [Prauserella aidingensis]|uniref:ABC transporter ATP-binding protein n=1 Tax=Prauserella aidingensis TaxID=387890 RepID=UPI0020A3A370|nr:ABC transporter ATP-binding protein [Prauserella aidingensis]MCP2255873.1 ABC-2 type transport system ATP-binding protein [Prauserella aidingensis]
MAVIEVRDIHKRYGETVAVDGVSFDVDAGEIFGVLGRNGAGKTTTVEIIEGLRAPDTGRVRVLGLDPTRDRRALRAVLGVQLQEGTLPDKATAGEMVRLYRSFYADGADPDRLLGELGLDDKRDTVVDELSGGQLQRLSIALALVGKPRVAVLDELTTGLDPRARRDTWELIEQVRRAGVTILLVTHFMDEAQRLCDRIAVFDRGRIAALDTPGGLVARTHGRRGASLDEAFLAMTGTDDEGDGLDDVLGGAALDEDGRARDGAASGGHRAVRDGAASGGPRRDGAPSDGADGQVRS